MKLKNRNTWVAVPALLVLLVAGLPAMAQSGVSEARGTVEDAEGNPVQGVTLTFVPRGNPTLKYTGKTNKKGRYFITGLWTPKENDRWDVEIEAEGQLPMKVRIVSRTVNKVLVGEKDEKVPAGRKVIDGLIIRPLGQLQLDLTVGPEAEVLASARVPANAGAAVEGGVAEGGDAAAPASPQKDPWVEATTLAAAGKLEESLPLFEKAIKDEPEAAERYEGFARVLYRLKRYDAAVEQASKAVELQPDRLDSRMVLYTVHAAGGNMEQAKLALEAALELDPQNIRVLQQMAFVAEKTNDSAGVIAAYEAITAVAPDNVDAWVALGGLYADAGQRGKSEAAYGRVAELSPEDSHQVFYNLGALIMSRPDRTDADTRRAIAAFRKAVEIKPDYGQAHQELAFALLGVGDKAGAREALELYVTLNPKAPDVSRVKGLIESLQ